MASVEVESAATIMPENLKSEVKIRPEPEAAKEEIVSPSPISNSEAVTEEPKEEAANVNIADKEPTQGEAVAEIPAEAEKEEAKDTGEEAQVVIEAKPEEETEAAKEETEATKEEVEAAKEEAVVEETKEESSTTKAEEATTEEEKTIAVNQVTVEKNEE